MWVHPLTLRNCFCKYMSFRQTLVQRRERWCPQCCAGHGGRLLLWDSPLHDTISVPLPSKKQRSHPLFSCVCNIKEATDKEEEGCLKTLENAKIRSKKDGEIVSVCRGGKPRSLVVPTLGEGHLSDRCHENWTGWAPACQPVGKLDWLKAGATIRHRSPVLWDSPTWGSWGILCCPWSWMFSWYFLPAVLCCLYAQPNVAVLPP